MRVKSIAAFSLSWFRTIYHVIYDDKLYILESAFYIIFTDVITDVFLPGIIIEIIVFVTQLQPRTI